MSKKSDQSVDRIIQFCEGVIGQAGQASYRIRMVEDDNVRRVVAWMRFEKMTLERIGT